MNIDWIIAPVTQAAILGTGLLGSLGIWISAKRETRATSRTLETFRLSTAATITVLSDQIQQLRADPVCETVLAASPFMAVQGLNLTTRTKVLRMHRRGEQISSIAAALGVQREEVDLLIKLDRMLESSPVMDLDPPAKSARLLL